MPASFFESFKSFIVRRRRLILIAWIVTLILSATQIPLFFSAVSYNITGGGSSSGGPTNTESELAQQLLNAEFPANSSSGANSVVVVFQGSDLYSAGVRDAIVGLNSTLSNDTALKGNFTGMDSVYSAESSLIASTSISLLPKVSALTTTLESVASGEHELFDAAYGISESVASINATAQLVYGIPATFVEAWSSALSGCAGSPSCADSAANQTGAAQVGGTSLSATYYRLFVEAWNESFAGQPSPSSPPPQTREQSAVQQAVSELTSSSVVSVPASEAQVIQLVYTGLNTSTWSDSSSIANLDAASLQSEVPSSLTSSLGITLDQLVTQVVALGPSPSNSTLLAFTTSTVANSASSSGASPTLAAEAFSLGPNPDPASAWDLASQAVSNATALSFSTAPLSHANATALSLFLETLTNQTATSQVRSDAAAFVATANVADYPLVMTRGILQEFVSANNSTMIVVFNFDSLPDASQIAAFRTDIGASSLGAQGSYWVTGNAVVNQDVSKAFGPALSVTIVPGVLASLLVVGILLLSPLAALVPVVIGGFAIAISLPAIYYGVVKLGGGSLGFLTPTLTILLVLGLSVDYSVLQLRRTREERVKGRSKEDSVGTSLRWAGQAVLTAGVTVVAAYLVMSVTKVPLFSDVGTSIAIAVSILIVAALTLLPALELTLGDAVFWPSLRRSRPSTRPSRLESLGGKTLRHKVAVIVVVGALAIGAIYVSQQATGGEDFFRLLPDFPSNHGLTVMTDNFGSAATGPTEIVVRMPSAITYGSDQLNQTLLTDIEAMTAAAASVPGVVSITSPTRPYGSPFNYSGIAAMPDPEHSEYLTGLLSNIGIDNRTALITVGLNADPQSQKAINILDQVESKVNSVTLPKGTIFYYGGTTQSTLDSQSFIDGIIPQVILTLAVAIYLILFLQLRSAFTPLRLIFTILCSVAFALAVLTMIFYYALSLPIFDFAPLFVIVTMLGVGIDYDIFLVTRIREEALSGKSDDEAIKSALSKSWVTIFGLGLVLSTVFSAVVFTGIALLQEIGLVVALAVMIDVSTVILFFVPALMGLAQRFNWWPWKIRREEK